MPTRREAVCDASSAILLTRADLMEEIAGAYQLWTSETAYQEMTRPGYPGSATLAGMAATEQISIASAGPPSKDEPTGISALGGGERDCIRLKRAGIGSFVILDDGPGVAICRRLGIAHTNALLMARILFTANRIDRIRYHRAMDTLAAIGRYSPKVITYANKCSRSALIRFFPFKGSPAN